MADLIVFTFDVPEEKQAEYLKATTEKIKPFWESHGCQAYDIWQTTDGEPAFLKTMFFSDTEDRKKATEGNPEAIPIVQLWGSFATNVSRKTYVQKTWYYLIWKSLAQDR